MRTTLLRWTALCATALCISGSFAQDAYITNASLPRYIKANQNYPLSMWIRNNGPGYVTSFSVRWRLDGGAWNNGTTVNITPPGLNSGGYYMPHTHQTQLNTTQGTHTLELNVVVTGDLDPTNNTVIIDFTAISTYAEKVVLLEARTETWCPNCPESNDLTNELMLVPEFAVAKFHLSDALNDCPECITYYNQYNINYTPAGMIELGEYSGYAINSAYPGWESAMDARAAGVAPVELSLTSAVDWNTRVLTATITANFTYAVSGGQFKLNVYAMENNVPGPQESAPPNYIHNRVMRGMLGGASGTTGVIPASPVVGTNYSHTYTWTVPAGFKIGDLKLIGLVEHDMGSMDRYALNAVKQAASPVGVDEQVADAQLVVYPNPFKQDLYLTTTGLAGAARAELVAMDGRVVAARNINLNTGAGNRIDLEGTSIQPGAYVLRLITDRGTVQRSVVRMD